MSAPTQEDFINIISSHIEGFEQMAEMLGKERFLVYKSEVHAPAEKSPAIASEDAEMDAIAEAFKCEIRRTNDQFTLLFYFDRHNPGGFLEVVDAGMPAPLAGGDNGTSHNPDGSTYSSPTPKALWDIPVEGYAKPATGVINEIKTMLKSLFQQEMNDAITASKKDIGQLYKAYAAERFRAAMGG